MPPQENTVMIEDARVLFPNFSGRETQKNQEGSRNFNVVIPDEILESMRADGWNVRALKDLPDGSPGENILKVNVNFKNRPPKIVMITSRQRTDLDESTVDLLDDVEIVKADIIIRPYHWNVRGDSGISAYLKTMFVTIYEDELELKYAVDAD